MNKSKVFLFIIFIVSSFLLLVSHYFFQEFLYMHPCEKCVYIRVSFLSIIIGSLVSLIFYRFTACFILGYLFLFYGIISGILHSLELNAIHKAINSDNPFGVEGCSTEANFIFNIPFDKWLPSWFLPTGNCGEDSPLTPDGITLSPIQNFFIDIYQHGWYFIPSMHFLNMAICCLIIFIVFLVLACVIFITRFIKKPRKVI